MTLTAFRRLLPPLGLLVLAVWLRGRVDELEPLYAPLLRLLPYGPLIAAAGLAAYSARARPFAAALGLMLAYWVIGSELQDTPGGLRPVLVYSLLSLAIPLTVLALVLIPERGLFNRYGLFTVALIPLQLAAGLAVMHLAPSLSASLIGAMPLQPLPGYWLSVIATLEFALCAAACFIVLMYQDSEHAASLLGVLVLGFVTLAFFDRPWITVVMLSAAGLSLIVSMLRSAYEMAYLDELTGLPGRRALNERLKGLGRRYVIAMLDVDHFKAFNDKHGHDVGDDVLKMVAVHMARVKGGGTAYRYGGEEFTIVFPRKGLAQCRPHLELVRRSIEKYRMALRDKHSRPRSDKTGVRQRGRPAATRAVCVTVSIGVAERSKERPTPEAVIKAADKALYKAKQNGRNCLVG